MSAELLAPGLAIGAAFESAYPVAKGNYYDFEARAILLYTTVRPTLTTNTRPALQMDNPSY